MNIDFLVAIFIDEANLQDCQKELNIQIHNAIELRNIVDIFVNLQDIKDKIKLVPNITPSGTPKFTKYLIVALSSGNLFKNSLQFIFLFMSLQNRSYFFICSAD